MQNQQIFIKVEKLEKDLKVLKALMQKTPVSKKLAGGLWSRINLLDFELDKAKRAIFDFDIEKFVKKQDIALWK